MHKILLITINLFICACVFDPADRLFHLKVPLFCLCWFLFIIYLFHSRNVRGVPISLGLYVFTMICIPLVSITFYFITNGNEPYEGFQLFKAYLFISFSLILYHLRINLINTLSIILTIMATLIICLYLIVLIDPSFFVPFYAFGTNTGIYSVSTREYSGDLKMLSAYFVMSPMLAISISHYVYLSINSNENKLYYYVFAIINIVAMFLAGTRNNMLFSIVLPISLIIIYSKKRALIASAFMICSAIFVLYYFEYILIMLSPNEESNEIKIGLLYDYLEIFSDPIKLIFGQGLGSYHYWKLRGIELFISEQTYLEVFRNFGLFLGLIMIFLISYPIIYTYFINKSFNMKHIVVGYITYLIMNATNPLLFSSGGMLILSIIIANIFDYEMEDHRLKYCTVQA